MRRTIFLLVSTISLLAIASHGSAQASADPSAASESRVSAPTSPAPAPATTASPAPATTTSPAPATVTVITTTTTPEAIAPVPDLDGPRMRFSMGIAGGGFFGDVAGGMGGLYLQLGLQINGLFGLYYQAHGMLGAFIEGGENGSIGAFLWNSLLFEVTLANVVQIGAGPAVDVMAGCGAGAGGAGCGSGGPFFGIDGRVALALGGQGPGTRGGFIIGADVHPTFIDGGVSVALAISIGGQVY